jgi:hypothetical protein
MAKKCINKVSRGIAVKDYGTGSRSMGLVINILHKSFILFMLVAWMSNDIYQIILYAFTLLSLKTHWYTNDDTCALTLLEQQITGVEKKESFINQIVSPVYKIKDETTRQISHYFVNMMSIVILYKLFSHPESPGLWNALKKGEIIKILTKSV